MRMLNCMVNLSYVPDITLILMDNKSVTLSKANCLTITCVVPIKKTSAQKPHPKNALHYLNVNIC